MRACGVAALAAASLSAQQFVGFTFNTSVGATSRGSVGTAAGEVIGRFDADDYAGWANDPSNPQQRLISSISTTVQDQDAVATPEVFDVKIYTEDPANANFPLISGGVTAVTGVAGPPAPSSGTIAAAFRSLTFATPVPVPVGRDVFVGFAMPAAAWSTDGLSFHINLGYAPSASFLTWDEPGPAMQPLVTTGTVPPSNSYGLNYIPTAATPLFYSARRQIIIDIATGGAGGVVTAVTNQTNYTISNTAPGTASFMSGLHPDAVNPPFTAGRADDIGYRLNDTTLPDNSLVFFLVTLGTFGPEVPLAGLVPGSTGVACLNPAFTSSLGIGMTTTGSASMVVAIPAAARSIIAGWPLLQQAIAYNITTGTLHAGACGRQLF